MANLESETQTPENTSQQGTMSPEDRQAYLDGLLSDKNDSKPENKPFVQDPRVLRAMAHSAKPAVPRELVSDGAARPDKTERKSYLVEDSNPMANASRIASEARHRQE